MEVNKCLNEDGSIELEIFGVEENTGYEFDGEIYVISESGVIMDCMGYVMDEDEFETIAVHHIAEDEKII